MNKIRTFKHSGNLGDIIYALPTIIALDGGVLYLATGDYKPSIRSDAPKPSPFSYISAIQMIALLKNQPYLKDVKIYSGESVDYDLDQFREHAFSDGFLSEDHLAEWHLKIFDVHFDLCNRWLYNISPTHINDIIITYSLRSVDNAKLFNWKVLGDYESKCSFIGFKDEYFEFKKRTGLNIEYWQVNNILEMAQAIKGSKLLVSNQTLGFALAEAMKHPRILDVLYFKSNSLPQLRNLPQSCNGHTKINKKIIDKYLHKRSNLRIPHALDRIMVSFRNNWFKHVEALKSRPEPSLLIMDENIKNADDGFSIDKIKKTYLVLIKYPVLVIHHPLLLNRFFYKLFKCGLYKATQDIYDLIQVKEGLRKKSPFDVASCDSNLSYNNFMKRK